MNLECGTSSYRPFGLSGRSTPRLGGQVCCIPFFSTVPALAPGLVVSQILCAVIVALRGAEGRGVKGDPSWV